jgi:hypothetical protein
MRGTSSPEDKLAGDLGNVIEATSIGGCRSDFFTAGKLALVDLGLLQQYRHKAAEALATQCPELAEEADISPKWGNSRCALQEVFVDPG